MWASARHFPPAAHCGQFPQEGAERLTERTDAVDFRRIGAAYLIGLAEAFASGAADSRTPTRTVSAFVICSVQLTRR